MNRILRTARVQLAAWPTSLGIPWLVVGIAFAINLAIFGILSSSGTLDATEANRSGALSALYVTVFVFYTTTFTQFFPMSLGFGVTRRTFYLATSLLALTESLAFAVLLYALKLIEGATSGWGVSMSFFGFGLLSAVNGAQQILIYAVPLLVMAFLGMFIGVSFKRWGATGLFTMAILALVVFGGSAVLLTWLGAWSPIGTWFAAQSTLSLFAGWPALLAAVLAVASFGIIRRATP